MKKYLFFSGIITIISLITNCYTPLKNEMIVCTSDESAYYSFGQAISISGAYLIAGASATNSCQGQVSVFKKNEDNTWNEIEKLIASDTSDNALFGHSVSVSGTYIIIGAPGCDSGSGKAYIFKENNAGSWQQTAVLKEDVPENVNKAYFGCSVGIYGNYAIVGANSYGKDTGSAYIYKNDGTDNWKKISELHSRDKIPGDNFGYCVSIYKNYVIIGAPSAGNGGINRGQAYIFKNDRADNWKEIAMLTASDQADNDYFGRSVSISGNYAIVGAPLSDSGGNDRGQAYIFDADFFGHWRETAIVKSGDQLNDTYFGHSIAAFGNRVIVGAPGFQAKNGKIHIFQNTWAHNWKKIETFIPRDQAEYRGFGLCVSLSGNDAVSSAFVPVSDGSGRGQIYLYY